MNIKKPHFRKLKSISAYSSPEELFAKLPNREGTHGYLRGPQTDALREYEKLRNETDVAFELPTGTGKTTVGLLVAEWRRRLSNQQVAYLVLTNQLAKQVLREAEKLGIECADLTGTKETRNAADVGRYKAGRAIGVTTYSNLFNVNPVIQASEILVFDDAHGGESYVSDMWTVQISADTNPDSYKSVFEVISPALTESQRQLILDDPHSPVELIHIHFYPELLQQLIPIIDSVSNPRVHFPWTLLRHNLRACLFFISNKNIVIRPLVPPTNTHEPFQSSKQRIYLSAILGGEGDLLRGYGLTSIQTIRAKLAQWGKRYIFMPELYLENKDCLQLVAKVWDEMPIRRALLLAPSFGLAEKAYDDLSAEMKNDPIKLSSRDIEETLEPFTKTESALLCLAGRYDGLDLPGDDCRLLIMVDSPAAVGALERHLREHWKLGPLLRRRERTRLIQGMGRCTRDATDYAIIILLGQSLIDSVTIPIIARKLPAEIQRELKWSMEQGDEIAKEDPKALKDMIVGLLNDVDYRKQANESLEEVDVTEEEEDPGPYDEGGKSEVKYSRALWIGDYSTAYQIARRGADRINLSELSGYRAWWWYLGSVAAFYKHDRRNEIDCLRLARATGINSGFIDYLLRTRTEKEHVEKAVDRTDAHAEAVWDRIVEWGWIGPNFERKLDEMKNGLAEYGNSTQYHIGLERLGQCIGAITMRPTEKGAPDVVWIFLNTCFTFEAKAGKSITSSISKSNVQQAKGHPEWLREHRSDLNDISICPLIVAHTADLEKLAIPHCKGLNFVSVSEIAEFAGTVANGLAEMRGHFAGKEYATVRTELKLYIKRISIDEKKIVSLLDKSISN